MASELPGPSVIHSCSLRLPNEAFGELWGGSPRTPSLNLASFPILWQHLNKWSGFCFRFSRAPLALAPVLTWATFPSLVGPL